MELQTGTPEAQRCSRGLAAGSRLQWIWMQVCLIWMPWSLLWNLWIMTKKHSAGQAHSEGFKSCLGERCQKHTVFFNFVSLTTVVSLLPGWTLLEAKVQIIKITSLSPLPEHMRETFSLQTLTFILYVCSKQTQIWNLFTIIMLCWLARRNKAGREAGNVSRSRLRKNTPGCLYWCFNQL